MSDRTRTIVAPVRDEKAVAGEPVADSSLTACDSGSYPSYKLAATTSLRMT
jgi:hypothetical protein